MPLGVIILEFLSVFIIRSTRSLEEHVHFVLFIQIFHSDTGMEYLNKSTKRTCSSEDLVLRILNTESNSRMITPKGMITMPTM